MPLAHAKSTPSYCEAPQMAVEETQIRVRHSLRVTDGPDSGAVFELPPDSDFILGRVTGIGAVIGDPCVSRRHAKIGWGQAGQPIIEDLGSANGTFLNGAPVKAPRVVRPHDRITVGDTTLVVERAEAPKAGDGAGPEAPGTPVSPAGEQQAVAGEEKGRRSLVDLTLRAGAVATALAAIVGLVTLLWPDAPPRLKAKLAQVDVDTNVRLSEFAARQRVADAGITPARSLAVSDRSRQGGQAMLLLATHGGSREVPLLAQAEAGGGDSQAGPGETEGSQPQPDGAEGPLPGPPVEDETPKSPSESDPPRPESKSKSGSSEIAQVEERVKERVPLEDISGGDGDGGEGDCSLGTTVKCEEGSGGAAAVDALTGDGAVAKAKALLKVLDNTRARSLPSGATEPLGVTLGFDLELEGFEGERVEVRWSLYDAGAGERVPRDWLSNRRALAMRPEAAFDRPSAEFWVPLPKQRGPFFVRLSAYDDQGKRLDSADSKSFR